ncbi:NADP-dependent oxidoreductase domain-containing protein [Lineolata rhizophorae]|uniref:NADP-dependent oxidoreductase domain-containing protein n=1 Tax=Lineolata rhizophorae TaxID=578093 RepID=A0A6A6NQ09_9PEZI|nr:NADP-dependent oxidoreductase domain-containing protein [Lineolata rhizophorae]
MASRKSALDVIFGSMTIGAEGREGIRVSSPVEVNTLLDTFRSHGHFGIDTARVYGGGTTEEYLGATDYEKRGFQMDTKLYPTKGKGMDWLTTEQWTHAPEDIRAGLKKSLEALRESLREVNKLHQEGYFDRFGLSNYPSWEVTQICEICRKNGWIMPTVYQGLYNAYLRLVESELVPCLRHYGLALQVFNPLAGGFLTGRYRREATDIEEGSRFDPKRKQGVLHRGRYWTDANFASIEALREVAQKHDLTPSECALRWLMHHSVLKDEFGDAVIVGVSSNKHLKENLAALDKGPLPEDVVQTLDEGWEHARAGSLKYWH